VTVYFLDSSAVVRLYAIKPGDLWVRDLVRSADSGSQTADVVVCDLAYPEAVAALHRMVRGADAARRGLSAAALRLILPRMRDDLTPGSRFLIMAASDSMATAAEIASRRVIQGPDSVHVAAAAAGAPLHPARGPPGLRERRRGAVPRGRGRGAGGVPAGGVSGRRKAPWIPAGGSAGGPWHASR
jgi:predicted nucleic acid-binding protein